MCIRPTGARCVRRVLLATVAALASGSAHAEVAAVTWSISEASASTSTAIRQLLPQGNSVDISASPGTVFLELTAVLSSRASGAAGEVDDVFLTDSKGATWKLLGLEFHFPKKGAGSLGCPTYFQPVTLRSRTFGMLDDAMQSLEIHRDGRDAPPTYQLGPASARLCLLFSIPAEAASRKFTLHFSGAQAAVAGPAKK